MATGEPIFTGFMRMTNSTFWAWFYSILYFLQMGWPGWLELPQARFLSIREALPGAGEAGMVYAIGVGLFLMCGLVLMIRTANRADS